MVDDVVALLMNDGGAPKPAVVDVETDATVGVLYDGKQSSHDVMLVSDEKSIIFFKNNPVNISVNFSLSKQLNVSYRKCRLKKK